MREESTGGLRLGAVLLTVVVVLGLVVVGIAWYFAGQLTALPEVRPFEAENTVLDVTATTVTLRDEGNAAIDGRWGLQLPGGRHAVLGEVVGRAEGEVTWSLLDSTSPPPSVGESVRIDEYVFVGDPTAVGLGFRDTTIPGQLGPLPVWEVPASGTAVGTVVFVHGRGATREEALRFLPALTRAGWDVLVVTYRGDGTGPVPDGERIRFGSDEWSDVEAAVRHLVTRDGSRPVVLMGTSMGGSLIAQFRDRSELADEVAGVVLDSPMLSMDALLDLQAGLNGVPEWAEPVLLPVVQMVGDSLYGLDSGSLEQVEDDATFGLPVLLFHGDADTFVPQLPSLELANVARTVTHLRMPEAGHVRSWNVAQQDYEDALVRYLADLAP